MEWCPSSEASSYGLFLKVDEVGHNQVVRAKVEAL